MAVSYKKLWILLIEKDMKKIDLRTQLGISTGALAKFGTKVQFNQDVVINQIPDKILTSINAKNIHAGEAAEEAKLQSSADELSFTITVVGYEGND